MSTFNYLFPSSLDKHHRKLHNIAQQCNELSCRNVFWRFLQQGVDQSGLLAMKQELQNAVEEFQVPLILWKHGNFVLITPQTNALLLQHFDVRSLSQVVKVINEKLGVLNIQQYTYTSTKLIYYE